MGKKYSKEVREYRNRLAKALRENKILKERQEEGNLIKKAILHETGNALNNISGYTQLLQLNGEEIFSESRNEYLTVIQEEGTKIHDIVRALYLDGCSKDELKKGSEIFSLEKMVKDYAHTVSSKLFEYGVNLNLKYNRPYLKEMEVNANKPSFEIIWGSLIGNAGNFSPRDTKIKQGIKFTERDLEMITENRHNKNIQQRKFSGLGKGIGLAISKKMINNMGGTFETFDHSIIESNYDVSQKFGYKETQKIPEQDYQTFAVKINIPLSGISF